MQGLALYALNNEFKKFNWLVLSKNTIAQKFYSSLGAKADDKRIRWTITLENMISLTKNIEK